MIRAATTALALMLAVMPAAAQTIWIAGDSTAATYRGAAYPQTGWGMMLPCALADGVAVENRAMGGRSTRTFVSEGRWAGILKEMRPGDAVLIQFGHNDANRNRPARYAPAATDYRTYLTRFVTDVRARGGTPVILTPVARRSFDGTTAKADFAEYSSVARVTARETGAALIDLEALSLNLLTRTGPEAAKALYLHHTAADQIAAFPTGIADDTHFSELGARRIADLVAGELQRLGLPVSASVRSDRPELQRETPLGKWDCR